MEERILDCMSKITPAALLAGQSWYDDAQSFAQSLSPYFGSLEHSAAVIAALSPRIQWKRNKAAAAAMADGQIPGVLKQSYLAAQRALASDDPIGTLKGPKTNSFAKNIAGDMNAVTIDMWAWKVVSDEPISKLAHKGVYDAVANAYRKVASEIGMSPAQLQATCWVIERGRAH